MSAHESYIEVCIRSLPAGKQAAARQAFAELSAEGDPSFFTKLLTVMDVTGTFARTIPIEIKEALDAGSTRIEALLARDQSQRDEAAKQQDPKLRQIISEELQFLNKGLGAKRTGEALEAINSNIKNLEDQVASMRHWRMGGLLMLMAMSFLLGIGMMYAKYADVYRELRDYYLEHRGQ